MVRHGQYNLDGRVDEERYLTELGRKQAEMTGQRLANLYKDYISGQLVGLAF
jgi:serine/threonine-protein phosphatase PGAM5